MASDTLSRLDFGRRDEPQPEPDLRASLLGWLGYQRHEFQRKWRDLTPEQLAEWSVPPVELSVVGLIRHIQQMEHSYLSWGLGGGERVEAYGDDDYAGGSADTVEDDLRLYLDEIVRADAAIAEFPRSTARGSVMASRSATR
ncbi:mycothiol transferase [Promicromonospora soli]